MESYRFVDLDLDAGHVPLKQSRQRAQLNSLMLF